jgi:hypothetical protein
MHSAGSNLHAAALERHCRRNRRLIQQSETSIHETVLVAPRTVNQCNKPRGLYEGVRATPKSIGLILAILNCMNKVKARLILIFCFSLFISKVFGAGPEGGICRDCSLNQQTSSQIVTSTRDLGSRETC